MMKPKFLISVFLICLLFLFSITNCQPKDKFEWNVGWSAPKFYGSTPLIVEYFYKGKSIAGVSAGIGDDPGWGNTSGGYTGGDKFKAIPDSVYIKYISSPDNLYYEGGSKLPREEMINLFKSGTRIDNAKKKYTLIISGIAPGGNATIWLGAGAGLKEIKKLKLKSKGVWEESKEATANRDRILSSEEFINSDVNLYRYIHGLPYKIWETGEKEYDYEVGFSDANNFDYSLNVHLLSKDGSYIFMNEDEYSIPYEKWLKNEVTNKLKKGKLPVHLSVQWVSKDNQQWYEGEIVLPNDFKTKFENFNDNYKNTNIFIVIDKLNPNDDFAMGTIWLQSFKNRIEVMKFRLSKADVSNKKFLLSKYSLPGDFQFPKWEGRIPILKPTDFDYWQEK